MKIASLQFHPIFGQKDRNIEQLISMIRKTEADLIVLPELCTTGYQFGSWDEMNQLSESIPNSPSIEKFCAICKAHHTYLVAGLSEKANDQYYNSAVLIGPDGLIGSYRKTHLFLNEKDWFEPGDTGFQIWDIGIAKIGMMICFDWIFPEAARTLALKGADIICHPSNLVLPYCQNAMITRSIENQVYTITTNRVGSEKRGNYNELTFTGGSQAVSPSGERLYQLSADSESIGIAEIEIEFARNKQITAKNDLFQDRRIPLYFEDPNG